MAQQIIDTGATGETLNSGNVKTNANFTELYGLNLKRVKVSLTAAQIKTLNSVPIVAVPAQGVGTVIKVVSAFASLIFGTVAFNFSTATLKLNIETASSAQGQATFLNSAVSLNSITTPGSTLSQIVANKTLHITASSDATLGDSTIDVYITYEVITL